MAEDSSIYSTVGEGSERAVSLATLHSRQVRLVYLITYSQADLDLVPTREEFSAIVLDSFSNADPSSPVEVVHWACSKEEHRDGGSHYHMAVKLSARRRWLKARNYLEQRHGVKVNFSDRHCNYYSAWRYTTKEDADFIQSESHPDLSNSSEPCTSAASRAVSRKRSSEVSTSGRRTSRKGRKSLSIFYVSQIAVQRGIRTRLELLAYADNQKKEGKTDLAKFIANRGAKAVDEALSVGWELEEAEQKMERSKKSRTEILYSQIGKECVVGCHGRWLQMARNLLQRNNINGEQFSEAIRDLLDKGRGKYRNLYLKGPSNCGKTFLLNPLTHIYNTFCNPASTTFAWVGAEAAEVLFLNDFRWSPNIIPWHDLLLLLEGHEVHLPAPKTHYRCDFSFKGDTPIFCTAKEELSFVRAGVLDERETEMMRVRWRVFAFSSQISEAEQLQVPPCPRCFAELVYPQS